jgi:hypothetical protein
VYWQPWSEWRDDGPRLALRHGHVERVEDDVRRERRRHRPADNATAPCVEDDREVQEAGPRRHVRDVGDPEAIRSGDVEVAIDEISRVLADGATHGRLALSASRDADDAVCTHQAGDTVLADGLVGSFLDEVFANAHGAVRAGRGRVVTPNALEKLVVRDLPFRRRPVHVRVKAARRDLEQLAHPPHGVLRVIRFHELEDALGTEPVS